MIKKGIITFFLFLCSYTFSHANGNINSVVISENGSNFCYKFLISNPSSTNITDWQIDFKIKGSTTLTSNWGGSFINNGTNFTVTGYDWNKTISSGASNIEIGFCALSSNRPENITFSDNTTTSTTQSSTQNTTGTSFDCSKIKTQSSCESGNNKSSCKWYNNSCTGLNQACKVGAGNLIQNGGFEGYSTNNIIKKWWQNILKFIGSLNTLPYWNSNNGEYKLWSNSDTQAYEGNNFLELIDSNSIFQELATQDTSKYLLSFENKGNDELEVLWNGQSIHKSFGTGSWIYYKYLLDGKNGNSKLEIRNAQTSTSNFSLVDTIGNDNCNKISEQSKCENSTLNNNVCLWSNNMCLLQSKYTTQYTCGYNNGNGIINLNSKVNSLTTSGNIINCGVWNKNGGNTINTGSGDDIISVPEGDNYTINLEDGENIFTHTIYTSQLTKSTITGGSGYNKVIFTDEVQSRFDIKGDCSSSCTLGIKNDIFNLWQGRRFNNITLKNIDYIQFSDSNITYNTDNNYNSGQLNLRVGVDDFQLYDVNCLQNTNDLMNLITPSLVSTVSNNSCNSIVGGVTDTVKKELVQKLINGQKYNDMAEYFWNSITDTSKHDVVKNETNKLLYKELLAYNESQKAPFYDSIYNQSIDSIHTCVVNNLNIQINTDVGEINYMKKNLLNCSQDGNTITLNFLNSYGVYKR